MKLKKRYVIGFIVLMIAIGIGIFSKLRKRGPIGPTPDEIVKEMLELDQNGDGQLSKEDLSERMQGMITRGDVNHDGVLNQAELRQLAQAQFDVVQRAASNEQRAGGRQNQAAEK